MPTQPQPSTRPIDQEKLNALLSQAVQDMGASLHAALIVIGDKLGLYKAMADGEQVKPADLAARTGTSERYVREWLNANAAGNYVQYHADSASYSLSPEQAFALALDNTPIHLPGFYHMLASCMKDEEKLTEVFRTGKGFGWHEHEKGLFEGCERFFRPGYLANLTTSWIPALEGVEAKLRAGAKVADVGCGHGASTILMAQAYPRIPLLWFRLPRCFHPASAPQGRSGWSRGPRHVRRGPRKIISGHRLRFRGVFRLPARHGRSGRRRRPCARVSGARRHMDGGGTIRRR
jgi:hypothetical protein